MTTEVPAPVSEATVLERVTRWVLANEAVRACVLTSSRAAADAQLDPFSDFDIVLVVVPNPPTFCADDRWIAEAYGEPMVTFRSEHGTDDDRPIGRLVLYADHTKIDFAVLPVAEIVDMVETQQLNGAWDVGWRVLVDKDRLTERIPAPTGRAHIPSPPSGARYRQLVEEFWWESTYVAKCLWRGDLLHAKYNLDKVMIIDLLRTLLEWRIEVDQGWQLRPGLLGRHFRERLAPETHERLERCFADGAVENNWIALSHTCEFFRDTARDVGGHLGFAYPEDIDANVTAYLRWVHRRQEGEVALIAADDLSRH